MTTDLGYPTTGRRRGRGRALAVVLAALTITAAAASGVRAADGSDGQLSRDDLGAEVVVGYGRGPDPARWSPVEVTFSPRIPIAGELAVHVHGQVGSAQRGQAVEVAAGATKVVHLLVPPGEELAVRFTPRDQDPLQLALPGDRSATAVYVGGIGAAPALPATLTSLGSDRAVRAAAVDPALLDAGPRAFEALDAVIVPAAELNALTDEHRRSLEVAVAQGLDLVVPVAPGDDDLPVTWDPVGAVTATGSDVTIEPAPGTWSATGDELGTAGGDRVVVAASPAGDGRVVATAAAPGNGDLGADARLWAAVLQPRADPGLPFVNIDHGGFSAGLFGGELSVPGSGGFALFVLVFVLVVGPINALALRRWGRRELAWVTVPAVTLVFTLVAIGSAATRAPTSSPVIRAAWWLDGVGEELTATGVQSSSRGTATVDLPAGHDGIVAEPWSMLTGTVARSAEGTRVAVPLEALQAATVVSWGPAGTPPLQVSATFVDDRLEVELTNDAASTLTDVEVHVATRVKAVDDLAAGATATVTVDELGDSLPRSRWADGHAEMGMGFDGRPREADPTAAVALLRGAVLDDAPGPVWVTAVLADDPTGTVPQVSGSIDDRGTVIAVGVTATRERGAVSPFEVQRQVLRTGQNGWRPSPLVVEGADEILVRFRLPPGTQPGDLVSSLDAGGPFTDMEMAMEMGDPWSGGCWEVTVTDAEGVTGEPEERCGDRVACPDMEMEVVSCGGGDDTVEAEFADGSRQVAVRIGDDPEHPVNAERAGEGALAGVEILDHASGAFVPASDAFVDGIGDADVLVSPLGEVLLRVRGGGFVNVGQRGLGVGGAA